MPRLCRVCKKDSDGKCHCDSCRIKHNEKTKMTRREQNKNGICVSCGKQRDTDYKQCSRCQIKSSARQRNKNQIRKLDGKCNISNCKNPKLDKSRFCEIHREESVAKAKKRCIKLVNAGLCTVCGKEPFLECFGRKKSKTRLCLEHYLKLRAIGRLGDTSLWVDLLNKLKKQDHKCFYTGEKLTLGENDSIDHGFPVSRFPERASDITNIVWVSREVNWMKDNHTHEEFMNLIEKIYKYRKGMGKEEKLPPPSP